jgi:hypothetical protein
VTASGGTCRAGPEALLPALGAGLFLAAFALPLGLGAPGHDGTGGSG